MKLKIQWKSSINQKERRGHGLAGVNKNKRGKKHGTWNSSQEGPPGSELDYCCDIQKTVQIYMKQTF